MDLIIANILVTVPTGIFESLNAFIFSHADACFSHLTIIDINPLKVIFYSSLYFL